jgi:hypothetical protein
MEQARQEVLADIRAQGDPVDGPTYDEVVHFLDEAYRDLESRVTRDCFVVSASRDGDSLSQWRAYTPNGGYAIGFRSHVMHPATPQEAVTSARTSLLSGTWYAVEYRKEEQIKMAKMLLVHLLTVGPEFQAPGYVPGDWLAPLIATCIKNPYFEDEREVRMVIHAEESPMSLRFRASSIGVAPYLEVGSMGKDGLAKRVASPIEKLPVEEIRISPQLDASASLTGLRRLLDFHGYPNVKITVTSVPYRQ